MTSVKPFHLGRLLVAASLLVLVGLSGMPPWRLSAQEPDPAKAEQDAVMQLKTLGLTLQFYHSENKSFPRPAIMSEDGKSLLSWRVAVLPYLEEADLYKQFHLDEPWDSEHNKPLVAKMPAVFRCPNSKKGDSGLTVYQVPRGPSTAFPGTESISLRKITDGTSNTIAIVETDEEHAVPWTKPEDWKFDPDDPAKGLGGHLGDVILTAFLDGRILPLPKKIEPATLKGLFTRNGREAIPAKF